MKRKITAESGNERLDIFIARRIPGISRSKSRRLIESGKVLLNGRVEKPRRNVSPGDEIEVEIIEEDPDGVKSQKIPLDIIYEDPHILVVNKPAGMVTHPAPGAAEGTLVNALLGYTKRLSSVGGPLRRGIIHRLDKDTTGTLIIARTDAAHLDLAGQISRRQVRRIYRALVMGSVAPPAGEISAPLGRHKKNRVKFGVMLVGGREALTLYEVAGKLKAGRETFSLLRVSLKTGRTHQIRVHLSSLGHPVCGDQKYGKKSPHITMRRQALHAEEVGFRHPATGAELCFKAPLPPDFIKQIQELGAG